MTIYSPRPWNRNLWTTGRYTIEDSYGMQICEMNPTHEGQGSMGTNADLIVSAVNNFADLLHIAKAYVAICEAKSIECENAKAVIAKAEGRGA